MAVSQYDGRGVIMPYPSPGWFGIILGITEDGRDYLVEVLSGPYEPENRPIFLVDAEGIERFLSDETS